MFNRNIICILLLLSLAFAKTTLFNPQGFAPKDEAEYASYLEVMLGHYVESPSLPNNIKTLITVERPSLLTAPEKVILILATLAEKDATLDGAFSLTVGGNELRRLVQRYQDIFEVKVMLNTDSQSISQQITEQQSKGCLVNVIVGQQKEIQQLERSLSQQKQASQRRRLQSPTQSSTDNTYLIKFFFSIIFILVIVACVGFISQNEGKKDTLLYAKFIADVGGR